MGALKGLCVIEIKLLNTNKDTFAHFPESFFFFPDHGHTEHRQRELRRRKKIVASNRIETL